MRLCRCKTRCWVLAVCLANEWVASWTQEGTTNTQKNLSDLISTFRLKLVPGYGGISNSKASARVRHQSTQRCQNQFWHCVATHECRSSTLPHPQRKQLSNVIRTRSSQLQRSSISMRAAHNAADAHMCMEAPLC